MVWVFLIWNFIGEFYEGMVYLYLEIKWRHGVGEERSKN